MVVPKGLRESILAHKMQGSNWCGRREAADGLKCAEWGEPSSSRKRVGQLAVDIKSWHNKNAPKLSGVKPSLFMLTGLRVSRGLDDPDWAWSGWL